MILVLEGGRKLPGEGATGSSLWSLWGLWGFLSDDETGTCQSVVLGPATSGGGGGIAVCGGEASKKTCLE